MPPDSSYLCHRCRPPKLHPRARSGPKPDFCPPCRKEAVREAARERASQKRVLVSERQPTKKPDNGSGPKYDKGPRIVRYAATWARAHGLSLQAPSWVASTLKRELGKEMYLKTVKECWALYSTAPHGHAKRVAWEWLVKRHAEILRPALVRTVTGLPLTAGDLPSPRKAIE